MRMQVSPVPGNEGDSASTTVAPARSRAPTNVAATVSAVSADIVVHPFRSQEESTGGSWRTPRNRTAGGVAELSQTEQPRRDCPNIVAAGKGTLMKRTCVQL